MNDDFSSRLAKFSPCLVADAIDQLKIKGHMPDIILLAPNVETRVAGPAHTLQVVPAGGAPLPKMGVHPTDTCPPGSVLVISAPPGTTTANWGGFMSTRAKALGLAGVVLDGRARDIEDHRKLGFPVFARGVSIHGSRGYNVPAAVGGPIQCGGVTVREGDYILGDVNGVVVIPKERIGEILGMVEKIAEIEDKVTAELEKGATITEVFKKYR